MSSMVYSIFPVGPRPVCLWGTALREDNRKFLEGVAYGFFGYLAETHRARLDGESRQLAALALRSAFHHGLETLFTMIGAAVQAPYCVPGWIVQCKTKCLRKFIEDVNAGTPLLN